jgi:hypothetical protein
MPPKKPGSTEKDLHLGKRLDEQYRADEQSRRMAAFITLVGVAVWALLAGEWLLAYLGVLPEAHIDLFHLVDVTIGLILMWVIFVVRSFAGVPFMLAFIGGYVYIFSQDPSFPPHMTVAELAHTFYTDTVAPGMQAPAEQLSPDAVPAPKGQ